MSYTTEEPLSMIIKELRAKLPDLIKILHDKEYETTLHGTTEMLSALIKKYDRGEIKEAKIVK